MIVKKVKKKNQIKSSFKQLAEYSLDIKNDNAKILVDYILDTNNEMEKVEAYKFSNCSFESNEDNINEIINTQKLNTTSKQDKTMHLIVSFQEDEKPSIETLNAIEKELLEALGMEHHQRLSVVHSNTNNLHIHIAINKVDPETLKVTNPYNDVGILQEAAIKIEKKYNLKVDNHISKNERNQNKYNIHTMTCNFESWVQEKLSEKIDLLLKDEKTTFDNIQEQLAEYDLEFRERRKGFVISSKSDKLFCKASSIHRELSKQQLEKRFGTLELKEDIEVKNKQNDKIENTQEVKKFNKFEGMQPNALWEKYQKIERDKQLKLNEELKHIKLMRNEFKNSIPSMKFNSQTFKHIKNQRMIFKNRTTEIYKQYKKVSYRNFLTNEALSGNEEAIRLLRRRKVNINENENTLSSKFDKPKIFKNIDYITKDGFNVYKYNENKIIDKADLLKVLYSKKDSKEVLLDSLIMSIDRFGTTLNITGNDKFKKDILDVVNEYNLDVKFIDKKMEKINMANKELKEEVEARKVLLKAINLKIEAIKIDEENKEKQEKNINSMQKLHKKISSSTATVFAGELNRLGLDYKVIDSMETYEVDIKTNGFIVNDRNLKGLNAMHEEIKQNVQDEQELKRFIKFENLFAQGDKVQDVTAGFYENRKIDVDKYIKEYDMDLVKLDKKANAIQLLSDKNLEIIKEFRDNLAKSNKIGRVQIIASKDEGLTNF